MAARDTELPIREPRGSRRRPDLPPPAVERIKPRAGLSRGEVIADQRRRILAGITAAVAYHGYEDTKIADIVELAGVSRPTFYEHFEGKERCFAAAYEDGVARLSAVIATAVEAEPGWEGRLSSGLLAGLDFLAADSLLAHLLLVESLAAARPARLEHERMLEHLAGALRRLSAEVPSGAPISEETARLLAGGLTSHLSGRVLAGKAEGLAKSHGLLLDYLAVSLTPSASHSANRRHAAHG